MSGHSKWNNIKRKKEKTDAAKARIFTKIGREISVIVKQGGANPAENSKLKDAIAKAKAANVPNDNIERIIKKAAGEGGADNYEELVYEGYGPNGVAVIVETLTDNRNRTAADVRHYFDKFHGNLGQSGSVMFMFDHKGQIVIEAEGLDEDAVMMDALDAGAEDFPQAVPRPQGRGDQVRGAWPRSTGAINLGARTQTTLMSLRASHLLTWVLGRGAHLRKGALE